MKITVTKDNVKIEEFDVVHEGEHRVNKCSFSFSEEYTEELVKKAIFTSQNSSVEVAIINNECNIPTEILKARNIVLLGVYAYKVVDDKLDLRYSPSPDAFKVNSGSYIEGASKSEEITPSQFEQYMQALNDGLNKVEESLKKMDSAISSANDLVDNINQKLENGDFIGPEGPQGPQGGPGKDGKDGVGITTITSGQSTVEDDKTVTPVTVQKSDGSSESFNVEAKNGLDGQNGKDGKDGVNGQDGLTPSIGENGNWYLGDKDTGKPSRGKVGPTPDLSDYVKNTDYASASKAGVLKINGNAARISSDGVLSAAEVSEEQYKTTVNSIFISKGTLDNVKNFLVDSSTPVITLNSTLDNLVRKNRVSDYIVSLKDALKYKVFEFLVHGKVKRETTTGKNKLDYTYLSLNEEQSTLNGGSYTYENGLLEIDATKATNNMTIRSSNISNSEFVLKAGTYYAHVCINTKKVSDGTFTQYMAGQITLAEDVYINQWFVPCPKGTKENTILMIEPGNEKTEWEPYTGGQPSPSPDYPSEITTLTFDKITRCGKNLLPNNLTSQTINGVSAIVNDDKSITVNGTAEKRTVFYLYSRNTNEIDYILPKGINFILKSPHLSNDGINFQLGLYEPNKPEEYITATRTNDRQFKLDNYKILNYFALIVEEGQTVNLTCYPQLEIGTQATEYEPYEGQTYDIDLQGNEMVELPNGVKDELVVDKYGNVSLIKNVGKVVYTNMNGFSNNGQNTERIQYLTPVIENIPLSYGDQLDNIFKSNVISSIYVQDGTSFAGTTASSKIRVSISREFLNIQEESNSGYLNALDELLQSLNESGNPFTIYYPLATPEVIPLGTLSELITTEEGINTFFINGNLETTLEVLYARDSEKYLQQYIDDKLATLSQAIIEEG